MTTWILSTRRKLVPNLLVLSVLAIFAAAMAARFAAAESASYNVVKSTAAAKKKLKVRYNNGPTDIQSNLDVGNNPSGIADSPAHRASTTEGDAKAAAVSSRKATLRIKSSATSKNSAASGAKAGKYSAAAAAGQSGQVQASNAANTTASPYPPSVDAVTQCAMGYEAACTPETLDAAYKIWGQTFGLGIENWTPFSRYAPLCCSKDYAKHNPAACSEEMGRKCKDNTYALSHPTDCAKINADFPCEGVFVPAPPGTVHDEAYQTPPGYVGGAHETFYNGQSWYYCMSCELGNRDPHWGDAVAEKSGNPCEAHPPRTALCDRLKGTDVCTLNWLVDGSCASGRGTILSADQLKQQMANGTCPCGPIAAGATQCDNCVGKGKSAVTNFTVSPDLMNKCCFGSGQYTFPYSDACTAAASH